MRLSALLISASLICASLGGPTPAHAGGIACFTVIKNALSGELFRASKVRSEIQKQENQYFNLLNSFAAQKTNPGSLSTTEIAEIRRSLIMASDEILRLQKQRTETEKVFRTVPMHAEYVGESIGLDSYRMDQHLKGYNVHYIQDSILRDDYLMQITKKGKFQDINGDALDGIYDAVMDQDGKIYGYLRDSEVGAYYNHSSFFSGLPVAAAVELRFVDGRLVEISGQSGHYKPSEEINQQLLEQLRRKGLDTSRIKYSHLTRLAN